MHCRHLHLRKFNSGTEYGDLWACLDCPATFLELPEKTDHDDNLSADIAHNELRGEDVYSYII